MFEAWSRSTGPAGAPTPDRLRSLHVEHGPDSGTSTVVTVFCAHDAVEFDALADVTD